MENDQIELTCLSCGHKLLIAGEFEMFVICRHCQTEYIVNRGIGVVSLIPYIKRHRSEEDFFRENVEVEIKKLAEEIAALKGKLNKQVAWIRVRKTEERVWLHGVFAGWRIRSRQEPELENEEIARNDNLSELDTLTARQTEELIAYFVKLAVHYPNDRRISNLSAVFQNMMLILVEIEKRQKEIEKKLLLLK